MLKISEETPLTSSSTLESKAISQVTSLDSSLLILTQSGVLFCKSDASPLSTLHESENTFVTCFDAWRGAKGGLDGLVVGLADGSLEILNKMGHVQKTVKDAHKGAITTVKVSHDGQSILSSGEDCACRLFSRNGMLRNELGRGEVPVFAAAWAPDNSAVALAGSKTVSIRKIAPGPEVSAKIAEGAVLFLDFSTNENLILAAGEDSRFALIDFLGRVHFNSQPFDFPFVSGKFLTNGSHLVLVNVRELLLADKKGSILHRLNCTGGLNCLTVARDSPQFWIGTLEGKIVSGFVMLFEPFTYKNLRISLKSETKITVADLNSEYNETIELPSPPNGVELFDDRLLIVMQGKLMLVNLISPTTPNTIDVPRESFAFARLQSGGVAIATLSGTLTVAWHDYGFRAQGSIKMPIAEISGKRFAASEGWVCWVDPRAPAIVSVDCVGQKAVLNVSHSCEVFALGFSAGKLNKKLLMLDANQDLHLVVLPSSSSKKVASLVSSFIWHETLDIFAWQTSGAVNVALAPAALSFDAPLFKLSTLSEPITGTIEFKNFYDATLAVQKEQRTAGQISIDSVAVKLLRIIGDGSKSVELRAGKGLKLARFVKNKSVWAILACFCLENRDTSTAEVALAALDLIDRVQFLSKLNSEESAENQQYLFFCLNGKLEECEKFLLNRKKPVVLVKTLLKQFEFQRALEIAQATKSKDSSMDWLVDLALHSRKKYLEEGGFKEEFLDAFKSTKPTRSLEEVSELKKKFK